MQPIDPTAPTRQAVHDDSAAAQLELVVTYDPEAVTRDLLGVLQRLDLRLRGGQAGEAIGAALLDRFHTLFEAVARGAAAAFRITVIGEFKRGKSTLIDAVLGEEVAPTDPLPETVTVNTFRWGETFSAELRLVDGGRISLPREALRRARLVPVLQAAPQRAVGLDVRLPLPALRDIVLVDTPGTGDLGQQARQMVREHIATADVLIVVISAVAPLSGDERSLLRSTVKPHDFPKILFVLNMVDTIHSVADIQRLADYVAQELGAEFPGVHVYPLSALDELARRTGGRRPRPEEAGRWEVLFRAFHDDLTSAIEGQRHAIRADRVAAACDAALGDVDARLGWLARSLNERRETLDSQRAREQHAASDVDHELAERRERVHSEVAAMADAAAAWMEAFADRVVTALSPQLRDLPREQVERDLQFFLAASVEAAVAACLETHAPKLAELSSELLGQDGELTLALRDSAEAAALSVYTRPQWTISALVRTVVEHVLGLGLLVDIGTGVFVNASGAEDSGQVVTQLRDRAKDLRQRFAHAARMNYERTASDLVARLEAARAAGLEAAREAAQHAEAMHRTQTGELGRARQAIDEARGWIGGAMAEVQQLRGQTR